ncbi:hypothetical protein [Vibrio panuliri]|uniref:Uncharacterized protein n=1 Tax=Vibrio panuliri TaxID=1381081 RepID=A0ABX3FIQ2_9VIBR|nr:hypothetical protein [Vibrio panuliri]KAB1460880.1 hypothetical protein F7O85_00450 [Vibrio panuliri]OLQ91685.1 hypothetical protein BIY20_09790 [Vibrio panuliri]
MDMVTVSVVGTTKDQKSNKELKNLIEDMQKVALGSVAVTPHFKAEAYCNQHVNVSITKSVSGTTVSLFISPKQGTLTDN